MASIGIVGAGLAGAGAADALRGSGHDVVLLEQSRGVGGRAATRRRNGYTYDHGANYVKEPEGTDGRTADLIRELGEDGLVDVEEPVWTFDGDGELAPGDREEEHKFTWEAGITQFAKRLLARTDAEVRTETEVGSIARADGTWTATDAGGGEHGPFDALLLTPPAPRTAALLGSTGRPGDDGALSEVREAAEGVPFRTVRTVVLNYALELDVPWYGLVNTDGEHDVGWLSREECKRGHVPDGETLLVAQMSPDWSVDRYDDPLAEVAGEVAELVAGLVGDRRLRGYEWVDGQGWRYALPDAGLDCDADALAHARDVGLFVAGDWVAGEGRVHGALWDGVDVGERIAERL